MKRPALLLLLVSAILHADPPPKAGVGQTPQEFEAHYQLPPLAPCRLNPPALAGMESIAATVDIGARRFLTVVGLREGKVADYRSLPLDARPEGKSCGITCFNKEVSVKCTDNGQPAREFRYFWNKDSLMLIRRTGPDETESAVTKLFSLMHEGGEAPSCEAIRAIPGVDQPKYSGPDRIHAELTKDWKDAQQKAKKKRFTEAAQQLAKAFTTTTRMLCCAGWLQCSNVDSSEPRAWIDARIGGRNPANLYSVAYPIPNSQFLEALRDYASFLDESGEHLKSIPVYRLALERDPQNTELHLGLADALWAAGDHNTGADEYRRYADIFAKTRALPKRVKQRMRKG